jgi:hypothetical protein
VKLLTKQQILKLQKNGLPQNRDKDHLPVVKLFTPDANATWLLTEIDHEEPSIAFGLCDLGLGFAELGSVSLDEIASLRGRLGLPVERDMHFEAKHPISVYAEAAFRAERITENAELLAQAAAALKKNQL